VSRGSCGASDRRSQSCRASCPRFFQESTDFGPVIAKPFHMLSFTDSGRTASTGMPTAVWSDTASSRI
jgi:hypothetical protein